jgi:hypothetical protein
MKLWISAFVVGLGLALTAGCAHHHCDKCNDSSKEACKDGECPMKKNEAQAAQPAVAATPAPTPEPTPVPATPTPAPAKAKAKKK